MFGRFYGTSTILKKWSKKWRLSLFTSDYKKEVLKKINVYNLYENYKIIIKRLYPGKTMSLNTV